MRSLLEPTFGHLWGALGPLLGGSWASLGRPWASKMGPKRVRYIGILGFGIPSCSFFRFLSLRGASGSPLGRVLAPSWPHLGPIWGHLGAILRYFSSIFWDSWWILGSTMDGQLDQPKIDPIVSKQPGPAECRFFM